MPHLVKPEIPNHSDLENRMNDILIARDSLANKKSKNSIFPSSDSRPTTWKEEAISREKGISKELFNFDPNTITDQEWKKLGLNSGQIRTIKNYKSKGGKFFKKEDVAKMYCISQEQYEELSPFITIREKKIERVISDFKEEETLEEVLFIDINTADTTTLKKLKGIGSYYAKEIVEYREELGGFVRLEQLLEIWKFSEETFEEIKSEIQLGSVPIKKIHLNYCGAKDLIRHSYISWKEANALIAFRNQHGPFKEIDHITKSHLISEELCQRIKPYLTLD